MAASRVLVMDGPAPARERASSSRVTPAPWLVLRWVGALCFVVGMLDVGLAWFPSAFGSPEWEFGTITASLNGLALPAIGLLLALTSGVALESRWTVRSAAATLVALAMLLVGAAVLYVTVLPVALDSVSNPVVGAGLRKAIVKSSVLLVLYPAVFVWLAVRGWILASTR